MWQCVVPVPEGCYVWAQLSNLCGINQVRAFVCIQETSSVELGVALIARRSKVHHCSTEILLHFMLFTLLFIYNDQ